MPPVQVRSRRGWSTASSCSSSALLAVVAVAVASMPVSAQQTQQVPATMSLEEAIALGLRNNPQYLQTTNDVDVNEAQVRATKFELVPTVSLGANVNANYRETQTAFDDFGQPLEQPEAIITKTSSSSQFISVGGITLFDGGRTWRNIDIAELNTENARIGVRNQANILRADITNAYFQVVNAEGRIQLEEQLLQNARDRLLLVEEQFRIAAARQTDLLGAEVDVAIQEQSLAAAQAQVRRFRLQLLQTIGVRGLPEFQLTSDVPGVFDPATLDADALVARAVASHPAMLQAVTSAEIAEKNLANSRSQRLPSLQLGLPGYSWGEQRRGLFDAWGELGSPNRSFTLSLSASLPVFTGFQTSAAIEQSRAAAQDQRWAMENQRLQVEASVRSALIDLDQRYNDLLLAQEQAELSRTRLELAQEEYRLGATNFTQLQQIIEQNATLQRQVLDAQLQFLTARVTLERNIGGQIEQ